MNARNYEAIAILCWMAMILYFVFLLLGCSTQPLANAIAPPAVMQLDLHGTIDGYAWDGVALGSDQPAHQINIESRTNVNYMRIISCHRFESYPDAIKNKWYKPNRAFTYSFNESPGLEDTGTCVLRLQAFTKDLKSDGSPVGASYGLMLFKNAKFTLPAENICNGADGDASGSSLCQSMNGLLQRLRFKTQVITADPAPDSLNLPPQCDGHMIDANTWEMKMPTGECMIVFAELAPPHRKHIHLAYGFTQSQYREEE